jgi:hypothetical protein
MIEETFPIILKKRIDSFLFPNITLQSYVKQVAFLPNSAKNSSNYPLSTITYSSHHI